jgi:NTP pyrophosphatase (non-canonical NTP hydrolase)
MPPSLDLFELQQVIEAASASYAQTLGLERTDDWLILKTSEEMGEVVQAFLRQSGRARARDKTGAELTRDLADEVADLLGMTLLLVERFGVDIVPALERKWHIKLNTD